MYYNNVICSELEIIDKKRLKEIIISKMVNGEFKDRNQYTIEELIDLDTEQVLDNLFYYYILHDNELRVIDDEFGFLLKKCSIIAPYLEGWVIFMDNDFNIQKLIFKNGTVDKMNGEMTFYKYTRN